MEKDNRFWMACLMRILAFVALVLQIAIFLKTCK